MSETLAASQLGFGLGLRAPHVAELALGRPAGLDWLEIISENYLQRRGLGWENLQPILAHYPVVMHGVSLSIGSTDALDRHYLAELKALAEEVKPVFVSDHLCFTGVQGVNTHDLLPLPYTQAMLQHVVERVDQVQQLLGRPLVLENPSTYLEFSASSIPEWEFLAQVAQQTKCLLLLDVNNIYVNCFNHGYDAEAYLAALPLERVAYMHLAGHSNHATHIVDTHDAPVVEGVWDLYRKVLERVPCRSVMIERDDHIPPLSELLVELASARFIANEIGHASAA